MTAESTDVAPDTETAMMSDRPSPWAVWARRSLPASVVPNQCSDDGGAERLRKSGSSKAQWVRFSPASAKAMSPAKMTRPTTAVRFRRKRRR